jgi:penicillin-binding protein 1C
VLDNANGEVLAMLGSRDYLDAAEGRVNAALARRSPGSALKPFVYALALEDGATPSSSVLDVPTHYPGYQPRSLRRTYQGAVPLGEALGSSLNVPAVRTAHTVGIERVRSLMSELGLLRAAGAPSANLSLALGSEPVRLLDLAAAYACLARGGAYLPPRLTLDDPPREPRRVLSPRTAHALADILSDRSAREREFGLETPLELPFPVAAKSGTSQAFGDNVVVGFSSELTVAVWIGNFAGKPMRGLLAMDGAAPLFRSVMLRAMQGRPARPLHAPEGQAPQAERDRSVANARAAKTRVEPEAAVTPHLVAPPDGTTFVIDPQLPIARQRVELRAEASTGTWLRFSVNGVPVATLRAPAVTHVPLQPGTHRVRVESLHAGQVSSSSESSFEVKSGEES